MFWNPTRYLKGATVAVLGGGPSLTEEHVKQVRSAGLRVIGVNDAYRFGNNVDLCFFGDAQWFFGTGERAGHAKALERFYGLKVTCAPECCEWPGIFGLARRVDAGLWPVPCCKWYYNSGLSAIGLAVVLGASRIVLLGFDGQAVNGSTHWHNDCIETPDERVFRAHQESAEELMRDIRNYAGNQNATVWNATPNSAYMAFPEVDLTDFLKGEAL